MRNTLLNAVKILSWYLNQVEVVEGVAGEEDHHDDQEEQGEENAEAEGQHDEHDEDGEPSFNLNAVDLLTCLCLADLTRNLRSQNVKCFFSCFSQEATWSWICWLQLKLRVTAKATTAIRIMRAAAGASSRQPQQALKLVGPQLHSSFEFRPNSRFS